MTVTVARMSAVLAAVGFAVLAPALAAHHAFSAEFDAKKPIKLRGTVSKVEWVNPHAWIHIHVIRENGKAEDWMIEGGTPNALFRRGITRESLQAGTEIVVAGFRPGRKPRANGRDLTLADGRKLFLGSSGTGIPDKQPLHHLACRRRCLDRSVGWV
jgi:hypothetical protein